MSAETGIKYQAVKESVDFLGKRDGFKGKPRELWHPYDRKSGTGRGRELVKSGHGKGNWGNLGDELQVTRLDTAEEYLPVPKKEIPRQVEIKSSDEIQTKLENSEPQEAEMQELKEAPSIPEELKQNPELK